MALQFARKIHQALYSAEYLTGVADQLGGTPQRRAALNAALLQAELGALTLVCELIALSKARQASALSYLQGGSLAEALANIEASDEAVLLQNMKGLAVEQGSWLNRLMAACSQLRTPQNDEGLANPMFASDLNHQEETEGLIRVVDTSTVSGGSVANLSAVDLAGILAGFRQVLAEYRAETEEF